MAPEPGDGIRGGARPLVSVIMNCFNGAAYLREAVDSVVRQSYDNWEIVFWDNQSTDRSAEIFSRYAGPRFRYFLAPEHTLLYEARNHALEKADGELVAFLDVDDWWAPEKLAMQVPLFDDATVGLVCGNYWIENDRTGKRWLRRNGPMPEGNVLNEVLRDFFVGIPTLVVRKSAMKSLAYPCDPRYHVIGDFDLVVRLLFQWRLASVQTPVAHYRLHGANESARHRARYVDELIQWRAEMGSVEPLVAAGNWAYFGQFVAYAGAINAVLDGDKSAAMDTLKELPWGRLKCRLLAVICMPTALARYWKK